MRGINKLSQLGMIVLAALVFTGNAMAEEATPSKKNIRYKAGKSVDFENLLIQGELQRPDIAVVTGDASQGSDGLLRLRENFLDRMASDIGESAK